jgi:hypothetical protein
MNYDLNIQIDRERFKRRVNALYAAKKLVELKEYKPQRTDRQNRYLHVILGEFAMETGCTLDWVKREYFKKICNPSIFLIKKQDKYAGDVEFLRSSAELTTEEMTTAIERFRNWSVAEAGIYLPAPNEHEYLDAIEREMQYKKEWL